MWAKQIAVGIRAETLVCVIMPVILSFVLVAKYGVLKWQIASLTMACGLLTQMATNLANEYYDYVQGHDVIEKKPLVANTAMNPDNIKYGFIAMIAINSVIAIKLISYAEDFHYILYPLAIICAICTVWYTKGRFSIARLGLGDLFVLLFFGIVPVVASYYLQTASFHMDALIMGVGSGMVVNILLTINNLRDREEDTRTGKHTLIVRFGEKFGRYLFIAVWSICAITIFLVNPSLFSLLLAALFFTPLWILLPKIYSSKYDDCFAYFPLIVALYLVLSITSICDIV